MIFYGTLSRLFNRDRDSVQNPDSQSEKSPIVVEVNTIYPPHRFLEVYLMQGRIAEVTITLDRKPYREYFPDIGPGEHKVYVEVIDMNGNRLTKKEKIKV